MLDSAPLRLVARRRAGLEPCLERLQRGLGRGRFLVSYRPLARGEADKRGVAGTARPQPELQALTHVFHRCFRRSLPQA